MKKDVTVLLLHILESIEWIEKDLPIFKKQIRELL